jgi:nitroreductase
MAVLPVPEAVKRRRAVRHFKPDPLPPGLLEALLDLANRAPSGFNLQPWHFVVVTEAGRRGALQEAALGQAQVAEAPATVIFVADPDSWRLHLEEVLAMGKAHGAVSPKYEREVRRTVPPAFAMGPLGLLGLARALFLPLRRLFTPTPVLPVSRSGLQAYAVKQTMLAAQTFMLAAAAHGLDTCPMEGFDEVRVKRLLGIPRRMAIPVIVPVGYAQEDLPPKPPRFPLERKLHRERF